MAAGDAVPLIGVSTYRQVTSWWSWERDAAVLPGAYFDLVAAAGAQPVLVPPLEGDRAPSPAGIERLADGLDGLVLSGGGDLEAVRYGEPADRHASGTNPARDALELALLDAALARDLPVLAICRGMQVLNVGLGGDLTQHLPDLLGTSGHQPRPGTFAEKEVTTSTGSTVRELLGERLVVLCSHHQAIGRPATPLVVTARSDDGVVEAVELPGHRFVVGVQWHPEESGDRRLFDALVAEARGHRATVAGLAQGTG